MLGFVKGLIVNAVVRHVKKMVPAYHIPDAMPLQRCAVCRARA